MTARDPFAAVRRQLARSLRPPAVVLDCSFVNGLAAIRSLHAAGAAVIAVDHRPKALGLRSRAAVGVVSPDPADAEAYVAFLERLGAEFGEPAVAFPTHDAPLELLARNAGRLAAYTLPGSGWEVLGPLQQKRHQYEAAARAGVATPRTFYPQNRAEALRVAAEIAYPAVVKPSDPIPFKRRFGRPVLVCEDREALLEGFDAADGSSPMLQEVVPGGDDSLWTVGSYTDAGGSPLGLFCGRKLLQMPRNFGTCRVGEARWRDDAVEQALALLRELGYHGIAQTEFREDARDGSLRLMEVNPRLWQWHSLARACGVDLPRIAYEDVLGRPPSPVRSGPEHDGRRWVAAVAHLRASHAEGVPFRRAIGPLRGGHVVEATLDRSDPVPALVTASGLVTAPLLRGFRRLVRGSRR